MGDRNCPTKNTAWSTPQTLALFCFAQRYLQQLKGQHAYLTGTDPGGVDGVASHPP